MPVTKDFHRLIQAKLDEDGLTPTEAARLAGVSDGTIRAYTKADGDPKPTTRTLRKIANGLDLDGPALFRAAGLPVPPGLLKPAPPAARHLSVTELFDALRQRVDDLAAAQSDRLPPVQLTDAQLEVRDRIGARLRGLADEARTAGDRTAADAIADLIDSLDAQLETSMSGEVSKAQTGGSRPGQ